MIDFQKSAENLKISLQKKGIKSPPAVDLAFVLDVSGSFDDEHRDGLTDALLARLVPWAIFDLDNQLEVFTFSSGPGSAHYVGNVTPETCQGYVQTNIVRKVPGYGNGTDYHYVIEKTLEHFGWKSAPNIVQPATKGFFGFGAKPAITKSAPVATKKRSIILFVTDGDNSDHRETERVLSDAEKRGDQVYYIFLGVSRGNAHFPFIDKMGEKFGNVGFVAISDVGRWVQQGDDVINDLLLGDELVNWLKA